ncbi:MAG: hypothetical protein DI565_13945 [Ancylobacter novellus]|uniref:Uncharacterized protein n=1 Tax=Ancylobacter novellus TaxID=921 RepID=A0A2W5MJL3_ANCNO|nr:MAG: hypothetical protein DI565_13945 [Ancylobacter novellus]
MLLREKGKADAAAVPMGWDEAQAAIAAGTHVSADAAETAEVDDLDALNKTDLEKLAAERGVDISTAKTKADIVEALRKA